MVIKDKPMFWLTLIGIIIAIIGIILGIFDFKNNNTINVPNSSLIQSPIIQESPVSILNSSLYQSPLTINSPNTIINYPSDVIDTSYYQQEIFGSLNKSFLPPPFQDNFSGILNVKIILPDYSEVFLEEEFFNIITKIGLCNVEMTDCYVNNKFRKSIDEKDICLISKSKLGNSGIIIYEDKLTQKFLDNPLSCLKKIE